MDEPVFVIHGVGNRDRDGFMMTVGALGASAGLAVSPIYWGDLGADDTFVDLALALRHSSGLRDEAPEDADAVEVLTALLGGTAAAGLGMDPPPPVHVGVRDALGSDGDSGLRTSDWNPETEQFVLQTLAEQWSSTRWLSSTDDEALLRETGRAIAEAVTSEADDSYAGLRGPGADREKQRGLIRRRLANLDRVAGAAMQAVAGRVNHSLRTRYGPASTRFLGDVLVYQRHRAAIQARVREQIAAVDPLLGTSPDHRVRVAAHSLGGVIAVDMATAQHPLWISSLVTFGSQSAYFHLCDPRGGQLLPYRHEEPVALPPSLARWTNLWQPLDVLAFAASRVFRLADGTSPLDVPVRHIASAGLWTHSEYWEMPQVTTAIAEAMRPAD
ncbi:hypothetical protein [Streptomyces sp. NBC_00829]|uniref:hypothetical protein n=1 Tax=Streptomyces sp. NBC_00829 TaxID=2903679 RepID=UPI003870A2B8|nr:lipase family protein [Streptomyces sp. NBC_00829]